VTLRIDNYSSHFTEKSRLAGFFCDKIMSNMATKTNIADGKKLAEKILKGLGKDPIKKSLLGKKIGVVTVSPTPETVHFINKKKEAGAELGLAFEISEFQDSIGVEAFIQKIKDIGSDSEIIGLIIQLPLPKHLDTQKVFNAIPVLKDIDLLSEQAFHEFFLSQEEILPPVVGAIDHLIQTAGLDLANKSAVILGAGKLIGIPSLAWLARKRASVLSFGVWSENVYPYLINADIVIAGLGNPGILKGECLKNGVCVFDVGYSVVDGKAVGDVDFDSVKLKAKLITPVPGGIGPLTVAVLFENVFKLYKLQNK